MQPTQENSTYKNSTRRFLQFLPVLLFITLVINGCAVKQPVPRPSYPKQPPSSSSPKQPSTPSYPSQPPPIEKPVTLPTEPTGSYSPKTGPAGSLYTSAQEAIDRGNYQQAEMSLERALRIEPRNGHYWYSMAQVKYKQQQYSQAMHLCSKSKSFAGKNTQLIGLNDALIHKAQQQLSK